MPVVSCHEDGKSGWKWGISGTCYTGKSARLKAEAQGRAILAKQRAEEDAQRRQNAHNIRTI